ncbi:hypothetical protein BCR39DRAFT_2214 [Naematelia encephala]|uniref:CFAP74 fourth Ig-like domain-containing protein n=1 Tax=Naematelia encephala TaxID=71784 RepID=A0A1Y2BKN7_9TREE|nr:hypothetical protein BCR39DRAFT_2214 [Naematelia encephala]
MSNIIQSVGGYVEAGVKGIIDIAEGYIHQHEDGQSPGSTSIDEGSLPRSLPVPIASTGHHNTTSSNASSSSVTSSIVSKPSLPRQKPLVEAIDVPSGWIHLQSTYLDVSGGHRKIRSFGLRNVVEHDVQVEVESDLGNQLVFWVAEDDIPSESSASTSSSVSTSAGTPALQLTLPASTTTTLYLAFSPSLNQVTTPSNQPSPPTISDGGFTPRVTPANARKPSSDLPPLSPTPGHSSTSSSSEGGSLPFAASLPVAGSNIKASIGSGSRKHDPVYRSASIHGSIAIRATVISDEAITPSSDLPIIPSIPSTQVLNLPFFATVCKSLFTAAPIDPVTGLASAAQQSSGQLVVDFGTESVVGEKYHRDILLVNRSEIELVWTTHVVNSKHKDAVWFSLRDLDSENVFGVDAASQPVPLPALSSRHLRLELHVKAPIADFDFDFVISNVNGSGNAVTCRAIGSTQAEGIDDSLKVLSGTTIDFGQICDGVWARKMMTCKNTGDRPLDVHFSASRGYDVLFRLAGVAGEDMDEEMPRSTERSIKPKTSGTSTKDDGRGRTQSSHRSSRGASPASSAGKTSQADYVSLPNSFSADLSRQLHAIDTESSQASSALAVGDKASSSGREASQPPSRSLSRIASRTSSLRYEFGGESDEDDMELPFFSAGDQSNTSPTNGGIIPPPPRTAPEVIAEKTVPNQIEELTMRPGTEYRVFVHYRPGLDTVNPAEIAGSLRENIFKVYVDSTPASQRQAPRMSRRTINCIAQSCTSLIAIPSGNRVDFGEVTVGASKSQTISITNQSALSAKVEIAAISKVLSANRNVIVIPPHETVEEKLELIPRRINDKYEKQIFVRNLLNRSNDQFMQIRSKNVDVYNLTLHSHLYRLLTPSGANFLDFGSVVINSPTVRSVLFENLTAAPLNLMLSASQPEDVELFVKLEDAALTERMAIPGRYRDEGTSIERTISPQNGDLKERFMETLRELSTKEPVKVDKGKTKSKREKSTSRAQGDGEPKQSVGAAVAAALKKGGRGRPVQLYGNAVVFKDRTLLAEHEYLDLASGPPISAHRTTPRSKRSQLLDTIELEDKSKLSGQHPKVPKLNFAASAKATGLVSKDIKHKKAKSPPAPILPKSDLFSSADPPPSLTAMASAITRDLSNTSSTTKSPALTGRRADLKETPPASDVSKMSVDELLVALEQLDAGKSVITHTTLEDEEAFVRRAIALRKELQNLVTSGALVPVRTLSVPPSSTNQLIVIMTPNGSTRPHVSTRAKRADSRIFVKLLDFDRSLLSTALGATADLSELPVRDLIIRSSCVRSVLEVQQSSINFGSSEKGEVKSKTIVIHNKSDTIGMFRLRTSGSIASGDLKLGLGRYGVISAFGRKEVGNFSFTPSLVGNYQETIVVENVLDPYNDQNVAVKAVVRKAPAFTIEPTTLDFSGVDLSKPPVLTLVLTNVSKHERSFVLESSVDGPSFAEISLARDESDAGKVLSKLEEEELESILQKLKIARRKGKTDKISKYQTRLVELGVAQPAPESDLESNDGAASGRETPLNEEEVVISEVKPNGDYPKSPKKCTPTLTITIGPNQKSKILVELMPRTGTDDLKGTIKVFDRKNTDEISSVSVLASHASNSAGKALTIEACDSDPLHLAIMSHCLDLTLQCPVSQTAFCVGSTLFLPSSSRLVTTLSPHYPSFDLPGSGPAGLILSDGYSRQIPGNTHAEANALHNFRASYDALVISADGQGLPSVDEVLMEAECYATMEPCSVRTSGGPSCALELVRAKVRTVYLGVEEPPDFVQCEGVRILEEGGVEVKRLKGLEESCLKAARRGRNDQ